MDSLRFVTCTWCGQVFFLCRWCDDGDRYCTRACSTSGRRESIQAAGRRYQRTEAGRAQHAARHQRYLERREAAKVTHQTAEKLPEAVEVVAPAPVSTHDAWPASGEEPDHAFAVGGNRFEMRRDPSAGDGGSDGDGAEGAPVGDGAA